MTDPVFRPVKHTTTREMRNLKTEVTPEIYARLEVIAIGHKISLRELTRQIVDFALAHMEKPSD